MIQTYAKGYGDFCVCNVAASRESHPGATCYTLYYTGRPKRLAPNLGQIDEKFCPNTLYRKDTSVQR